MVSRGTEDDRAASPLEIVRGDQLRIGATHWEKQLFNGTVVTVDDFKVERAEAGTEPSVLILARTEDGRAVSFRHDEIRDWYGNIRLDHGYAMTITSAQGLTVDRSFLLADARPSRETIYPAATRHREGLDIYVNRAPLALDIADRRADNDREAAVTDTEIRTYLAERWSRSQPKEAALDYMADGIWEDRREHAAEDRVRSPGETRNEMSEVRAAANDNALARIGRDVRRTAFGWRHAQTVASFVDGRREVLASYDDLRERSRAEGDTVALGGSFQETLTRHAVLLKQAEAFCARPDEFASLLAERGSIGRKDLDAFEELHARARRHRRAATMRYVHRIKKEAEQEAQQPKPELRHGELALDGGRAEVTRHANTAARDTAGMQSSDRDATPGRHVDSVPPVEAEDYPWPHAAAAQEDVPAPRPDRDPPRPGWYAPCEALQRDWNELIERVRQTGEPLFYAKGYADIIPRIRELTENPDIPAKTRAPMIEALENHHQDLSARQYVEDYLDATGRHMDTHASLQRVAGNLGVPIVKVSEHLGWRQEADRLMAAAAAILAEGERYGPHLDNLENGRARVEGELSRLRHIIREDGKYAPEVKTPEPHGEPVDARENVEQLAPVKPDWYAPYEALRQDWNELVKMVRQSGEPLFYAKGYMDMIPRIRELMENPDILAKSHAPLIQALENHQRYLSTRKHILDYPGEVERHLDARASLQNVAADREVEPAGVRAYPDWRQEAERLTAAGEAILSGKGTYGAHLDRIVDAGTRIEEVMSDLGEAIREDDAELAERQARELRRLRYGHLGGPRFALDDGATPDPARAMSSSAAPMQAALSRLGRAIGYLGRLLQPPPEIQMIRVRQIDHGLGSQCGIERERPCIAGRGYHTVTVSADRAGRCRAFIGAHHVVKGAREREVFRIHVFPIEVGEGKPGRAHTHRVSCKVDDQGVVFIEGIYAAERPPRVLDVRVDSYMLRRSRLAAPQSRTAPHIVERRAVQEFEIGTNGSCRHRNTDPAVHRAFHRGRYLPERRRCFTCGQGRYCRRDSQRSLDGLRIRRADGHGDSVIAATSTTACSDKADHGGHNREVISSVGHRPGAPRVVL